MKHLKLRIPVLFLFAIAPACGKGPAGSGPMAHDPPVTQKMFEVEKTEVVNTAVEIRGCRVQPKEGEVLFVCKVLFTDAGSSLSNDNFVKLDVSKASKEFSKVYGLLIAQGDFRLRLSDKTLVSCSCLPQFSGQPAPRVMVKATTGMDDWLMYVGAVQVLASIKPDAQPESLIWGGKYEAAIPAK